MASKGSTAGGKRRKTRQKVKERYAKAREDAQALGVIATTPEGAVRDERVDPASQDEQRFPGLDRLAIRNSDGWGVNDHVKRRVIEVSAEVLFEKKTYIDKEGNEREAPPDRFAQAQAAKTLLAADKFQHEKDHPKDDGNNINISNQVAVVNWDAMTARPVTRDRLALALAALKEANGERKDGQVRAGAGDAQAGGAEVEGQPEEQAADGADEVQA